MTLLKSQERSRLLQHLLPANISSITVDNKDKKEKKRKFFPLGCVDDVSDVSSLKWHTQN